MGFKKLNSKTEEDFVNSARGDTLIENDKRDKRFLLYFTHDEFVIVKNEAKNIGMNVNQYIRFKLFHSASI